MLTMFKNTPPVMTRQDKGFIQVDRIEISVDDL